jgi:hypothetical protein
VLYPSGKDVDRMASPIILRPWRLGDGSFQALCVPLVAPIPEGLEYEFEDKAFPPWAVPGGNSPLYGQDLTTYPNSPMTGWSATGLATEAFLYYLYESGYRTLA